MSTALAEPAVATIISGLLSSVITAVVTLSIRSRVERRKFAEATEGIWRNLNNTMAERIENLAGLVEFQEKTIKTQNERITALRQEVDLNATLLNDMKTRLLKTEETLERTRVELDATKKELAITKAALTKTEEERNAFEMESRKLERRVAELERETHK